MCTNHNISNYSKTEIRLPLGVLSDDNPQKSWTTRTSSNADCQYPSIQFFSQSLILPHNTLYCVCYPFWLRWRYKGIDERINFRVIAKLCSFKNLSTLSGRKVLNATKQRFAQTGVIKCNCYFCRLMFEKGGGRKQKPI